MINSICLNKCYCYTYTTIIFVCKNVNAILCTYLPPFCNSTPYIETGRFFCLWNYFIVNTFLGNYPKYLAAPGGTWLWPAIRYLVHISWEINVYRCLTTHNFQLAKLKKGFSLMLHEINRVKAVGLKKNQIIL